MSKKSLGSRSTILAIVIAMALASLSATSVFAAGSTKLTPHQKEVRQDLASDWQTALSSLRFEKAVMDGRVKNNTSATDQTQAADLVNRFNAVLAQAEAVAAQHAGFSVNGTVTDSILAAKSVKELNADLHLLRGAITHHVVDLFV